MRKPKWVLFDYGNTLIREREFDARAGYEAVLRIASENPDGATSEDLLAVSREVYPQIVHCAREHGVDAYGPHVTRLIYEGLGMRFDRPYEEVDDVFWDAAEQGTPTQHTAELLEFLNVEGIQAGVVSNLSYSGASLRRRLDALLPGNDFRFVIASSDYGVRKPSPAIFLLALRKTGAEAGDVWFVGDDAHADVYGAARAGMRAIWYQPGIADSRADAVPNVPHIRVADMMEIATIIRDGNWKSREVNE
jgi:putative hydrolase of the HAD superfamily